MCVFLADSLGCRGDVPILQAEAGGLRSTCHFNLELCKAHQLLVFEQIRLQVCAKWAKGNDKHAGATAVDKPIA